MTAKLRPVQRDALVEVVMTELGNLLERLSEGRYDYVSELEGADPEAIRAQIATWARQLPGTAWDIRLGNPDREN